MDKPTWDEYFMAIAHVVSTRSIDPSCKHGCVLVDTQNRVVSTGYNGPIPGIDDSQIPLTRPDKYRYFSHAEEGAIIFRVGDTNGGTAYITGHPCCTCFRMLAKIGIQRIVYGNRWAKCVDEDDMKATKHMAVLKGIELVYHDI